MRQTEPRQGVIEACQRGDREAFRVLVETWSHRAHVIALHFSGSNETAAAEIVQEVFVKAWTSIQAFRQDADFGTWLYRLVANACIDAHRRNARWRPLEAASALFAPQAGPHESASLGERAEHVRKAVARLPPDQRILVLLRHYEELSYDEMAEVVGCSPGTVASRLSRGHRELARSLANLGDAS